MRNASRYSGIELLESRIAPAALVTVAFTKGALSLTGDTGDHDFSITALDATTFQLHAATGTLFHMTGATDTDTLTFSAPLKSITANLSDGSDHVSLVGLTVAGDVSIAGGNGTNEVDVNTVVIKGGFKVTGGSGADTISVAAGAFSVAKDAVFQLGDGANSLTTASVLFHVGGQLSYTGGTGSDNFALTGGNFSVAGNLTLTLGSGSGGINIATTSGFTVGKNITLDSSASLAGDAIAYVLSSYQTRIGSALQVTDGAGNLSFEEASIPGLGAGGIGGKISIVTGPGTASLMLETLQLVAKSITIDASASSSSNVEIGGLASGAVTNLKYTGGAGSDSLGVEALGISASSSVIADMGDGTNNVEILSFGGAFKTAKIAGGSGTNNVEVGFINSKISTIDIENGSGTAQTAIFLVNSSVSGSISVTNDPATTSTTFALGFSNAVVGSVNYYGGGGTNAVSFGSSGGVLGGGITGFSGLTVKQTIHVVTGSGDDTVDFTGAANVKVAQGINLELGDGTNGVTGTVANFVTKTFIVTGGAGGDTVALTGSGNLGAVNLSLGPGANSAGISGGVTSLGIASLSFTSTSAAGDADSLILSRVTATGNFSAKFGADASTLQIDDTVIGGTFFADTGAGSDLVKIDTGATNTGTILAKAVTISLGDGDDTLVLGGNGTSSLLTTKSTFHSDGGTGSNTLTNDAGNVFAKPPVFVSFP